MRLTAVEARILGCLIEKKKTTPEYYPLSLNALTNACNQKSNREPVMDLSETAVSETILSLRRRQLVCEQKSDGSRVAKYAYDLAPLGDLDDQEQALLCVLLLRGPQTPGELRGRTGRLCTFADLAAVETALARLAAFTPDPLAAALARQPGQKEIRYIHLLCGETEAAPPAVSAPAPLPAGDEDRLQQLEEKLADLERRVASLESRDSGERLPGA